MFSTIITILSTVALLTPFLGAGVLLVAIHTLILVSRTPPLRIHVPAGLFTYLLLFVLFAAFWALAVQRSFGPSSLPLSHYFIPSLYAIPSAVAATLLAIAGTHMYACSRPSTSSARGATAILALAATLAGLTLLIIFSPYMMRFIG